MTTVKGMVKILQKLHLQASIRYDMISPTMRVRQEHTFE